MTVSQSTLCYRGVAYVPAQGQQRPLESSAPVEHVYRGQRYTTSLAHTAASVDPNLELHYRGSVYHHRQVKAAADVQRGAHDPVAV